MRRLTGALILLVAALALVTVPAALRPGIAGVAVPAPVPPPPSPASCLDLRAAGGYVPVDCDAEHDGEVIAVWQAGDSGLAGVSVATCGYIGTLYLDPGYSRDVAGWRVSPVAVVGALARAPMMLRGTHNDWTACVVTAGGKQYTGSLTRVFTLDQVPDVFRRCAAGPAPSGCAVPHDTERIATVDDTMTDDYTGGSASGRATKVQLALRQSCEAVAATVTGAADPTYDGRLAVDVVVDRTSSFDDPTSWYGISFDYQAGCVLRSTAGLLTASVVGLGDRPLPVS